ncbi:SGNH/GDSL hydrolase family protein [Pontibacter mangrovi]|uniref:Acylhydrolase n=1 Tax=Pontibacter mangrovi TaxID=2589816 RepID=A0A501WC78_9BACT|nr:SGNH/GDSL hydrolase family protein [Pontibacter mangrovi]TPE46412.1 acylhydrolase [Pontibacter mangrovi]
MKKRKLFLILFLLSMLSTDFAFAQDWAQLSKYKAENAKLKAPVPGEQRVVFMGNSITEGWSNHNPEFFEGKPYINRGISGQTTPQMLVRFRPDVIDLKPAVVVILAGTNDIAGNTGPMTLEEIMGNIVSMAELAKANGIKVVLSSVLPAYDYKWSPGKDPVTKIATLNGMLKSYAAKNNLVYLDYYSAMADDRKGMQEKYTYDGVHPNKDGYLVMGPMADAAIAKALAQE